MDNYTLEVELSSGQIVEQYNPFAPTTPPYTEPPVGPITTDWWVMIAPIIVGILVVLCKFNFLVVCYFFL